ncbi:hypothetical protein HWV62_43327 [Athelia sp. TMB]|nr:hypothetical protein HWV62_43327 [Athelia sp. TMB]
MIYNGACYCGIIQYELDLVSPEEARTSLCHCKNCKKFFGSAYGLTAKLPRAAFRYTTSSALPTVHEADNGAGVLLHREFCGVCGSGLLEYGAHAGDSIFVVYGTMEDAAREALPPKGEFFCKYRESWLGEVEGLFQKQEIQE